MRISTVQLRLFKRFTRTTLTHLAPTVKLVMMAGPNGSGKSSFIEGMRHALRVKIGLGYHWDEDYFVKIIPDTTRPQQHDTAIIEVHDSLPEDKRKAIYVRSAYRNDPDFTLQQLERSGSPLDEQRLEFLIQNDATVRRNFQLLASGALAEIFQDGDEETTLREFREKTIGKLRAATQRLFPDLQLLGLGNPLKDGTFRFQKGKSKRVHYKNMSGGEKSAFDLLLDMQIKSEDFDETVFCIDEPEAHVNPRLHGPLLRELFNVVNDKSQLWIATHSPGMMREAANIETECPGTVAFVDFGGKNFDEEVVLIPEPPSRAFWRRTFQVAFDDAAELILPRQIIVCEGPTANSSDRVGDEAIYEKIFEAEFPDARFVAGGAVTEVQSDRHALVATLSGLAHGIKIWRLIDRDDRSEAEISELKQKGVNVLGRRHFEAYLMDDEVIRNIYESHERHDLFHEYLDRKREELTSLSTRGKPDDDIKAISNALAQKIKLDLKIKGSGSTFKEFAINIIVPFLTQDTAAYRELRADVFGPLTPATS